MAGVRMCSRCTTQPMNSRPTAAPKRCTPQSSRSASTFVLASVPLLPDVAQTVAALAQRHRLVLFTKGQRDEQLRKLTRSGLEKYFGRVETPREKDLDAYRRLILDAQLHPERAWMIGNSPRSDINPSVRAGLRAVYIPHPHTWELEEEELDADDRIVRIGSFRGLLDLF